VAAFPSPTQDAVRALGPDHPDTVKTRQALA
jgi:hypothetical protein